MMDLSPFLVEPGKERSCSNRPVRESSCQALMGVIILVEPRDEVIKLFIYYRRR
jgi:hypothetical protein